MAHYVDNLKFLEALKEHGINVRRAKRQKQEKPRIPDYIGSCILQIATHLAFKPNFINYSFKDEMISDAVDNCLSYLDNFDPKKSRNPFAYFTQISWYAFLRRIAKEKRVADTKQKYIDQMDIHSLVSVDGNEEHAQAILSDLQNHVDIVPVVASQAPSRYKRRPKYLDETPATRLEDADEDKD